MASVVQCLWHGCAVSAVPMRWLCAAKSVKCMCDGLSVQCLRDSCTVSTVPVCDRRQARIEVHVHRTESEGGLPSGLLGAHIGDDDLRKVRRNQDEACHIERLVLKARHLVVRKHVCGHECRHVCRHACRHAYICTPGMCHVPLEGSCRHGSNEYCQAYEDPEIQF